MDRKSFLITSAAGILTAGCSSSTSPSDSSGPLSITTTSLPDGTVGQSYGRPVSASGGKKPYQWSVAGGTLPVGLSLDGNVGRIWGRPTTRGESTFTIRVTDAKGGSAHKQFTVFCSEPRLLHGLYDNFDGEGGFQERQGIHLAQNGQFSPDLWEFYHGPSTVVPWDGSDGVNRGNVVKMETTEYERRLVLTNPSVNGSPNVSFRDFQSWSADLSLSSQSTAITASVGLDHHTSIPEQSPISWLCGLSLRWDRDQYGERFQLIHYLRNKNDPSEAGGFYESVDLTAFGLNQVELDKWYNLRLDMALTGPNNLRVDFYFNETKVREYQVPQPDATQLLHPTLPRFGPNRNFAAGAGRGETGNAIGFINNVQAVYLDHDLPPS